jgi:hypothetical protein
MDVRHASNLPRDLQDELTKACSGFPCDEKVRAIAGQYLTDYKNAHVLFLSCRAYPKGECQSWRGAHST